MPRAALRRNAAAKSPNYADLLPEFQDKWGPRISMQIIGIGYNPRKIKSPPKSWDALWDPQYKGRVGLTALNSQLGPNRLFLQLRNTILKPTTCATHNLILGTHLIINVRGHKTIYDRSG